jgi:replicative DNA helicase
MGSQLKRIEEAKRPTMTDFRGSGAIEEDTDIIIGLHRENYYDASKPKEEAEALILKGRHFGTGVAELMWDGSLTHFRDKVWQGSF